MSGEIFSRDPFPENLEDVDVIGRNPLMCYLCSGKYEDPCILGCYHSFCSTCLQGRAKDGKMLCPLCKESTTLKEGESLPLEDKLLQFLVMSSSEEREQCANCDMDEGQMYFCNTCSQPLCERCREETHRAKMFTRHDIVLLSKRTKEIHRECFLHHEPFILFSTEKKTMLCINCFRDMKIESRSYCVDMETAYHQCCKKLDQRMQAIRDLQRSVQDSILLLRALLEEITQNSDLEKSAINELYDSLIKEITGKKETLLMEVDRQYQDKQKLFTEELASLTTLLPTLHTHLVTCAAFSSSANKFEFLDLAYILMERLKSIIHLQYPLHPSQGSQIYTGFKVEIAKCLEPLLFPQKISATGSLSLSAAVTTAPRLEKNPVPQAKVRSGTLTQNERRQVVLNKLKLAEGKGVFADHCQDFDASHKSLSQMVERLKSHLQELQRDLTLRRCLTKQTVMEELQCKVEQVEQQLESHKIRMEQKQPHLEKYWEECVQRMTCEQEVYQAQLQDVMRIQQETSHLRTILNQLSRFVTSITALTERLAPKLATSSKESNHDNQIAAIFEQINTMEPDSQHRVEAIRTAEEERETLTANRTNPMDEELIKTKGLLRAPSARREGIQRKREMRDTKRDSMEKDSTPSPCRELNLTACLKEIETATKDCRGDMSEIEVKRTSVTDSPCKNCSTKTQADSLQESNEVTTVQEVKGESILSKVRNEASHSEKELVSNTVSKCDPGESTGHVEALAEASQPLESKTLKPTSESCHIKSDFTKEAILQIQNDSTNERPLSPRNSLLTNDEPALNVSVEKLGSKTSPASKGISCDELSASCLPGGHQFSEIGNLNSPAPSDISGCGSGSLGSDTPVSRGGSLGDMSEVEGQEDDMTGGETLRARIERLKVSIDNGTSATQSSKSPQDNIAKGSRSPQDSIAKGPWSPQENVSHGSRSPRNKCPLSNGLSSQLDVDRVASKKLNDSSCVGNGELSQKGDDISRSADVVKSAESSVPELKSQTHARQGSQVGGRRRRRVKCEQTANSAKTSGESQESDMKDKVTEVKGNKST